MSIRCVSDLVNAENNGGYHYQTVYKNLPSTINARFADMTVVGPFPQATYYTGDELSFTLYPSANNKSIFTGGNVAPATKYLKSLNLLYCGGANQNPTNIILCDYLGYYPLISAESSDVQTMDNTTTLPAYTDGDGVQATLVQLFGGSTGANWVTMTYVDQRGETKTTSFGTGNQSTGSCAITPIFGGTGTVATWRWNIPLAAGSTGIRSVTGIQYGVIGGGILALVLLKPIASILYNDSTRLTPSENLVLTDRLNLPVVRDDARLNLIVDYPSNAATTSFVASTEFVWG